MQCHVLQQMVHALKSIPPSSEPQCGRNAGNGNHFCVCPHCMRQCPFFFHGKTNTRTEISSIYQTLNSPIRSQQIKVRHIYEKPLNLLRLVFSLPAPSSGSSTAGALQLINQLLYHTCVRYYNTKLHLCHFLAK